MPLALPGDDVTPEKFTAFRVEGGKGLYIHPNIWHGAVVPIDDHATLIDRQGACSCEDICGLRGRVWGIFVCAFGICGVEEIGAVDMAMDGPPGGGLREQSLAILTWSLGSMTA